MDSGLILYIKNEMRVVWGQVGIGIGIGIQIGIGIGIGLQIGIPIGIGLHIAIQIGIRDWYSDWDWD